MVFIRSDVCRTREYPSIVVDLAQTRCGHFRRRCDGFFVLFFLSFPSRFPVCPFDRRFRQRFNVNYGWPTVAIVDARLYVLPLYIFI